MTATAGSITVNSRGQVQGPRDYIQSQQFEDTMSRIERGQSAVVMAAPAGVPFLQAIATAIQTDYAAWLGQRDFDAARGV